MARWAVGLAAAVAAVLLVSYAIFAVAYASGGSDAVSDNWVGYLAGFALIGGFLGALVAFVLGVVAKIKHERHWLWLPLSVLPVLLVLVVLAEMLWIE